MLSFEEIFMNKKNKLLWQFFPVVMILIVSAVLVTWQITYDYVSRSITEQYADIIMSETSNSDISRMIYNVDSVVRNIYNGQVDDKKLADFTINGYVHGLGDKYASYMNAEEYSKYLDDTKEDNDVGIGVTTVFDAETGGLGVLSVYEDTPAAKVGILPGEVITKVDGREVAEVGFNIALDTIRSGNIGSTLDITVRSDLGEERIVTVERRKIEVQTVSYRKVNEDTGLVRISEFSETTPKEIKDAIQGLTRKGAPRIILDIRNNPGGSLDSVVEILDFILPAGDILTVNEKNGTQNKFVSYESEFSAPMAVIVNGNTAGTAELFAAVLKSYNKAKIIGEKTYGKGSEQEVVRLPNAGAARISVRRYLLPSAISYDGVGIEPDILVLLKSNLMEITDAEDSQLQSALDVVKSVEIDTFQ